MIGDALAKRQELAAAIERATEAVDMLETQISELWTRVDQLSAWQAAWSGPHGGGAQQ